MEWMKMPNAEFCKKYKIGGRIANLYFGGKKKWRYTKDISIEKEKEQTLERMIRQIARKLSNKGYTIEELARGEFSI